MMRSFKDIHRAAAFAACLAFTAPAFAQQPTPAAMATAKEVVTLTGSTAVFAPIVAGVVEQAKLLFLQQNPGLSRDLNEIAAKLRTDLQPRIVEINDEVARLYAIAFTEQELKEILAFYKSSTGKKMLDQQP